MNFNDIKKNLENLLGKTSRSWIPISHSKYSNTWKADLGGDIFFVKSYVEADMAAAELHSIRMIDNTNTVKVPKIVGNFASNSGAVIALEWIESRPGSEKDYKLLGEKLAALHLITFESYGFERDNYIGGLLQSNAQNDSYAQFYVNNRLQTQVDLALSKGLISQEENKTIIKALKNAEKLLSNVKPSLLHGDLWSGNVLFDKSGEPFLIDPCCYFGHSESDIAMTLLFGGFGHGFYDTYFEVIPRTCGFDQRIQIYQLYYLLVHLNLFGRAYRDSVMRTVRTLL